MFDYMTLKVIWWLLIGVLLIGFAIMDGHATAICREKRCRAARGD